MSELPTVAGGVAAGLIVGAALAVLVWSLATRSRRAKPVELSAEGLWWSSQARPLNVGDVIRRCEHGVINDYCHSCGGWSEVTGKPTRMWTDPRDEKSRRMSGALDAGARQPTPRRFVERPKPS